MRKKHLISFIFLFPFILVRAQETTINGKVNDVKGKPLPAASITLKGTYDGALTDSTGNFHFSTTEKGQQTLVISLLGFKTTEQTVTIDHTPITITLVLKEELNELNAVTVTAGAFAAGDSKRAVTVLSSLDVATVGGGNADITSAVKTLPGAQQVGEQEGLFVRGGAGYETKQFIDGTVVNNPYYSSIPDLASRGRFSPFLFKGTIFSTGGYSALYGQALSSALILESIDLPEKTAINASLSPIIAGAGIQELAKNKRSSWGADYNYVNLAAYFNLVKQTPDYFKMPAFHNADANFRIKTKAGIIKYYTTFSYSELGLRRPDIDSTDAKDAFYLKNTNWYNNLSWRENLGNGWKMNLGAGYSINTDDLQQQLQNGQNQNIFITNQPWGFYKNFTLYSRQELSQVKAVLEKKLMGITTLRFGGEYLYSVTHNKYNDTSNNLRDQLSAAFAESDIYLTNALAAKIGIRYEYSSILAKANIAPRLSFAYKVGYGAQVSAAYGIFYQKPENTQLAYTTHLGYTKATHYIINYQKMVQDRIFRVEAFYKQYDNLLKTIPYNYYQFTYNNDGSGYAKGVELFWRDKKTFRNLDYWISYSYLDTKRTYLNFPAAITPNFAANHTASLVMKRFFTGIKTGFNVTYSYASGRPYYNIMYNGAVAKYNITDQGFTKDYHNLGFSLNYVPSVGKPNARTFVVLVASVTNVLGYDAVYGYDYSFNGMNKQPITPPAKRFYFIGIFLSWGVDRTQDAINNNL